jgi:ABC-2 type transport system ATP-binding protein
VLDLKNEGTTVVFSTHDMGVAERLCDRIFMIFRGRKVLDGTLESIQEQYGNDTIRVSAEGGAPMMEGLPNVEKIRDLGQVQELRMARGCDPQEVLRALVGRTRIASFAVTRPSLEDIFVRIAGHDAMEVQHA